MTSALIGSVSAFLDGVIAGIFVCSGLVEQAMVGLDAPAWIAYKQAKERLFGPMMPVLFGLTVLGAGAATVAANHRAPFAAALALLVAALAITIAVHLPLNAVIQGWRPDGSPPGWDGVRRRWRVWNWLRTVPVVIAFAVIVGQPVWR